MNNWHKTLDSDAYLERVVLECFAWLCHMLYLIFWHYNYDILRAILDMSKCVSIVYGSLEIFSQVWSYNYFQIRFSCHYHKILEHLWKFLKTFCRILKNSNFLSVLTSNTHIKIHALVFTSRIIICTSDSIGGTVTEKSYFQLQDIALFSNMPE